MELEKVLEKNRTMHHMMQKATVDALDFQNAAEQLHSLLQCSIYVVNKDGDLLACSDTAGMQLFSQRELEEKHCNEDNQSWILELHQPVYNQRPQRQLPGIDAGGKSVGTIRGADLWQRKGRIRC